MSKIIGNTTATPVAIPDWNQTDTTKADFIKNKPVEATDDEVMALLIACNVIMPVSDSTGYVYLDKDQKILVM